MTKETEDLGMSLQKKKINADVKNKPDKTKRFCETLLATIGNKETNKGFVIRNLFTNYESPTLNNLG